MRIILLLTVLLFLSSIGNEPEWGFFGHRKINRMAVFTLPPELFEFYKQHIEYITEHAVDPDKRRYATKYEAVRHYIDIDHWEGDPFIELPRTYSGAIARYLLVTQINDGDTTVLFDGAKLDSLDTKVHSFVSRFVLPQFYEDQWVFDCDTLKRHFAKIHNCEGIKVEDIFSNYGILPYHLVSFQKRLTNAFKSRDVKMILRISADIGHYIGDAHVPLHTTENYNGQLTGQDGIHAFWESRLPELYANEEYNFFGGRAEFIGNTQDYFWDIIHESHRLLPEVLGIEKKISYNFPRDEQYCYEQRLDRTVEIQCEAYSRYFHELLDGMVERRMRNSVKAIGSVWYTSWVEAGQPELNNIKELTLSKEEREAIERDEALFKKGNILGRQHGN